MKKPRANRIEINPKIMLGKPVIRGTRIPVYVIVNLIAAGKTPEHILKHYPDLKKEDVKQALEYAAWATNFPEQA